MIAALPMDTAQDRAFTALASRAVAIVGAPRFFAYTELDTGALASRCQRLTARRVGCEYRITIHEGATKLYAERGTISVARHARAGRTVARVTVSSTYTSPAVRPPDPSLSVTIESIK